MKILEVLDATIAEGGKTDGARNNSEVGLLYGLVNNGQPFDINDPSLSIPAGSLIDADKVYSSIKKFLTPVFNEGLFNSWAAKGPSLKSTISIPSQLGWVGGQNSADGAADINFPAGSEYAGISVKVDSGFLKTGSASALGIEPEGGGDTFIHAAKDEYFEMKRGVFKNVLDIAKGQPGVPYAPKDEKYFVEYNPKTKKFTCQGKKKPFVGTEAEILKDADKTLPWQRPFGDYASSSQGSKDSQTYFAPFFKKLAIEYKRLVSANFENDKSKLANILQFGDKPYYYFTGKEIWEIPSRDEVSELTIKSISIKEGGGISRPIVVELGLPDSEQNAQVSFYVRFNDGAFVGKPIVSVQSLRNLEHMGWKKIGDVGDGSVPKEKVKKEKPVTPQTPAPTAQQTPADSVNTNNQPAQATQVDSTIATGLNTPGSPLSVALTKIADPEERAEAKKEALDNMYAGYTSQQVLARLTSWLTESPDLLRIKQLIKY